MIERILFHAGRNDDGTEKVVETVGEVLSEDPSGVWVIRRPQGNLYVLEARRVVSRTKA